MADQWGNKYPGEDGFFVVMGVIIVAIAIGVVWSGVAWVASLFGIDLGMGIE